MMFNEFEPISVRVVTNIAEEIEENPEKLSDYELARIGENWDAIKADEYRPYFDKTDRNNIYDAFVEYIRGLLETGGLDNHRIEFVEVNPKDLSREDIPSEGINFEMVFEDKELESILSKVDWEYQTGGISNKINLLRYSDFKYKFKILKEEDARRGVLAH